MSRFLLQVHSLRMTADHSLFYTEPQYLCKHIRKNGLREKLPCTAYRGMPWQLLVDIIANEEQDVQPHGTVVDQLAVTDDVLQVAHQAQLEEHHRVDTLLATVTIIILGKRIEKM